MGGRASKEDLTLPFVKQVYHGLSLLVLDLSRAFP